MKSKSASNMETLKNQIQQLVLKASKSTLMIGLFTMLLGIFATIYPATAGQVSTVSLGIVITLCGVLRFGFAIFSHSVGSILMRYMFAIIMIVAGIWIINNPEMGLETLAMYIAIYFIADGITSISYSLTLQELKTSIHLIIAGLFSILFGILIINNWPDLSKITLGTYLGIKILVDGTMLTYTSYVVGKSSDVIHNEQ